VHLLLSLLFVFPKESVNLIRSLLTVVSPEPEAYLHIVQSNGQEHQENCYSASELKHHFILCDQLNLRFALAEGWLWVTRIRLHKWPPNGTVHMAGILLQNQFISVFLK
jgi:hypothetical protein